MTTITQTITALPTAPARTDDPSVFITRADAMMAALPTMVTQENTWAGQANTVAGEVNSNAATATTQAALATTNGAAQVALATTQAALATTNGAAQVTLATAQTALATTQATNAAASAVTAVNAPGTNATSTTSLAVSTGSKSLTIQTSKSLVVGMSVKIAYTVTPTTWMFGDITAHDSTTGALTVNVTQVNGSGTQAAWTVSLSGPSLSSGGNLTGALNTARATVASAATTADIWAAAGNQIDWTGTVTCTAFPAAPQAGSERVLITAGAAVFTAGANMLIDGVTSASNLTCAANDQVIVRAVTTTQFKLSRIKYDGTSQVAASSIVQYPQLIKSANYTLVLADAGYQIFHPATDTAARTFTIPANSSVAFPIGTTILFIVQQDAGDITLQITTDTLRSSGGITGTKTLRENTQYTAVKIAATEWLLASESDVVATRYFAVTTDNELNIYGWSGSSLGIRYNAPAGTGRGVAFSPDGKAVVQGASTTTGYNAYRWSSSGFGVRFDNPATGTGASVYGVAFSPDGKAVAGAGGGSIRVHAHAWSSAGFGTKFSNPATLPTGQGEKVAFSPAGTEIAVAHETSPYISAYPWSSAGFGVKFANPATGPAGSGRGVAFSPAGTEIAVAHDTSLVSAYQWSSSGFGTRFANPATLPADRAWDVEFSPAGTEIALAGSLTPFIHAYPWSSAGFGVKFANPATLPTGTGYSIAFSSDGKSLGLGHATTPFVSAYAWTSAGFGVKFDNPATLPTDQCFGAASGEN